MADIEEFSFSTTYEDTTQFPTGPRPWREFLQKPHDEMKSFINTTLLPVVNQNTSNIAALTNKKEVLTVTATNIVAGGESVQTINLGNAYASAPKVIPVLSDFSPSYRWNFIARLINNNTQIEFKCYNEHSATSTGTFKIYVSGK